MELRNGSWLRDANYTEEELNDAMTSKHIVRQSRGTNNSLVEGDFFRPTPIAKKKGQIKK
jgi:hypothetical protein